MATPVTQQFVPQALKKFPCGMAGWRPEFASLDTARRLGVIQFVLSLKTQGPFRELPQSLSLQILTKGMIMQTLGFHPTAVKVSRNDLQNEWV